MLKRIFLATLLIAAAPIQAQEAPLIPFKIGDEWTVMRASSHGSATHIATYSIARTETLEGRNYIIVRVGDLEGWLVRGVGSLARIVREGQIIDRFDPDWNDWQWPLAVGKTWMSEFRHTTKGVDLGTVRARSTVTAVEDVTVPAGTFQAYRIERLPLENSVYAATRWYAPSIGLPVKKIVWQTDRPGEVTEELMSYKR